MNVRTTPLILLLALSLFGCAAFRAPDPPSPQADTTNRAAYDPSNQPSTADSTRPPQTAGFQPSADNGPVDYIYAAARSWMSYSVDMVTGWFQKP